MPSRVQLTGRKECLHGGLEQSTSSNIQKGRFNVIPIMEKSWQDLLEIDEMAHLLSIKMTVLSTTKIALTVPSSSQSMGCDICLCNFCSG